MTLTLNARSLRPTVQSECFRLAMRAALWRARPASGDGWSPISDRWIVVSRRGVGGAVLTVGVTVPRGGDRPGPDSDCAPPVLQPVETMMAMMVRRLPRGAEFLFLRSLPRGDAVEGRFVPSDGCARLEFSPDGLGLEAAGRFAELGESGGVTSITRALDDPRDAAGEGWMLHARHLPWAGELLIA